MAKTKITDVIRSLYMDSVKSMLENDGEEVLLVKSGTFSIPWVRDEEEGYINITFSIPKGSRDGDGYNGHEEAMNYAFECAEKEAKAKAKAEEKAKKMAKDKAKREAKKE